MAFAPAPLAGVEEKPLKASLAVGISPGSQLIQRLFLKAEAASMVAVPLPR